jgi:hypothetical protein
MGMKNQHNMREQIESEFSLGVPATIPKVVFGFSLYKYKYGQM